jgi:beta-barrel assembly-enhancing protease
MTDSIKALVFGPGLPTSGVWGMLVVRITGIEITTGEQTQRATFNQLQLREVGFGTPGVELAWTANGETWAVHVLDPVAAASLLASPAISHLPHAQALKSQRRRHSTSRTLGWSLLGLFVLLPLILLVVFFMQADRLAGWVAERIPIEQEIRFGQQAFDSMKSSLKLQDEGAAYQAVNDIGKRLTQGSTYPYQFHVVNDATLNAFAMPGGIVVVNTGLIKATKRAEELAGVLAHETQHVEQRHSIEGIIKQMGLQAVWLLLTGDLGSSIAGQAALKLTSLKFSRDAESEADAKGFDTLVKQGIDPSGMPEFFKTMSEQAADAPAAFLSTHPLSEDRQAKLSERAEGLGKKEFKLLTGC